MAKRVKGPDGTLHEFPDDATDAEIAAALDGQQPAAKAPESTSSKALDLLLSSLPSIGGAAGGIIGGIGGSVAGFGVGGVPGAVGGAALGGGLGESLRSLAELARGKPVPTAGETAKGIGAEGALQGVYELAGQGVVKGMGAGAKAVYRGYLKPSLAKQSLSKAEQVVETALQEALPITKAGENQANTVIAALRKEVDAELAKTPGTVDLHQIAERVRTFAKARFFKPGKPAADYEAALAVADSLDKHASLGLPAGAKVTKLPVSASQANTVKRGIDEAVGDANFGVERGAVKTTQKVARREVRKDIEKLAPQVGPINAREGKLIDASKAIARAVGREENKSPLIGVNTMVAGLYGGQDYARNGDPFAAAAKAAAMRAALTPAVASRAAIVAYRLGKLPGALPANAARIADMAVRAVLQVEQESGQP